MRVLRTAEFDQWLATLRDLKARIRIAERIRRLALGNLGDVQSVGEGVSELRIHYGPGYRLYIARQDRDIYLLLCGGDKSTQARDIRRAQQLAKEI